MYEKDSEIDEMKGSFESLLSKYNSLRNDHHKLIGVTKEMRLALELAASGTEQVDWTNVMLNCSKAYPELFSPRRRPIEGNFGQKRKFFIMLIVEDIEADRELTRVSFNCHSSGPI